MGSTPNRPTSLRQVDPVPMLPEQVQQFSIASPEERAAVYLKSMRRMMIFFTVATVIALVGALVLGIIDVITLNSIHQSQIPSNPFG